MGFLDRLLRKEQTEESLEKQEKEKQEKESGRQRVTPPAPGSLTADAQALERYRYMLTTAPPNGIEQAHAEAFAKLTPEQRRQILAELMNAAPPEERAAANATSPDDPHALGRLATRTELRQPGFMERTFGGPGTMGMGFGTSLLGSFAMGFLGSMVAQRFFHSMATSGVHDVSADQADPYGDDAPTDPDMEEEIRDEDLDVGDFDV